MKGRPILFNAEMVRAVLSGAKTQTRRICKPAEERALTAVVEVPDPIERGQVYNGSTFGDEDGEIQFRCPLGQPRDRLWVRETFYAWGRWETRLSAKKGRDEWHFVDLTETSRYRYAADGDGLIPMPGRREAAGVIPGWWKRPSIFMPHQASRIALEISGVRVQRLQDISTEDALAEGVNVHPDHHPKPATSIYSPVQAFRDLWESINGSDSWDENPWVWAINFAVISMSDGKKGRPE